MIIVCPNCNKKFEIDNTLIPSEGRMLQCGSCDHKWFYKAEKVKEELEIKKFEPDSINIEIPEKSLIDDEEKIITKEPVNLSNSKKNVDIKISNVNYFKLLLVIIITFISLILVLDTFKEPLKTIFPNIQIILNNLYQSLKDIKLFILDLIK